MAPEGDREAQAIQPRYLGLARAELSARARTARSLMRACRSCPRACGVDRAGGEVGTCGTARLAIVDAAFPHRGEESCLSGWRGSGTIFFAHCNLECVFCQNWEISQIGVGREYAADELASAMLRLQLEGCHNINLVTPEHVVPQVVEGLVAAIGAGLRLPVVYNTSAYDALDSLRLLDGLIDIYMPDFKFWERDTAARLCGAADYPDRAREAIAEMHRQVGPLLLDDQGIARRGVLVRHLVLPGHLAESAAIFRWLACEVSPATYVNVMDQYRPAYRVRRASVPRRLAKDAAEEADDRAEDLVDPADRSADRAAGGLAGRQADEFRDIARRPRGEELCAARAAARAAGLWRFADEG